MEDIEIVRKARTDQARDAMIEATRQRDRGNPKGERRNLSYAYRLLRSAPKGR